jgi:long-chain acyl-CoA synthetase
MRTSHLDFRSAVMTTTTITDSRSVATLALRAAERYGDTTALTAPGFGAISYAQLETAVREIACGLAALGIEPGDRVAILSSTRPEWTLSDFGALAAGATVVPIYHTNSPEECAYVLHHSEARAVFCEDAEQLAKVEQVRDQCPALEHVVLIEGTDPAALPLVKLRAAGGAVDPGLPEERVATVSPDDVATIVYTSGTTGPPKGCATTHANLLSTADMYRRQLGLGSGLVMYLYLPLAHSLARIAQAVALDVGGTIEFWGGNPKRIVDELAEVRPTHFPSVPRVYEKIRTAVLSGVEQQDAIHSAVFRWALAEGGRARARERSGAGRGALDRVRHGLADRLVLSKVRGLFGDRLQLAMTGAAPIGKEVLDFFDACGVVIAEGYGMTESCAAATLNTPAQLRFGTVGRPLPDTEVAIAADAEVLMRGPHIFAGYHRDAEATEETVRDGWLHSGEIGELDADGFLRITGRKKDLIITSSGKNISPDNIESMLRESRWISQAVVYGDRRPYLVALLTLDPDEAPTLADEIGVPADPAAMAADPQVRAVVARDVGAVNRSLARVEQVKRFDILDHDLTQAAGELTPTLKVKRARIQQAYGDRFTRLYESS